VDVQPVCSSNTGKRVMGQLKSQAVKGLKIELIIAGRHQLQHCNDSTILAVISSIGATIFDQHVYS